MQAPVRQCRHGREAGPDEQVAEDEQRRGHERPSVAFTLPHHSRKQQHHRCCRWQHHRHHHHGPHDEHEDDVVQAPGLGTGHGHAGGHGIDAHRAHAGGKSHRVGPSERGEDGDRRDQHSSVTPDELAVGQVGSHRETTEGPRRPRPRRSVRRRRTCTRRPLACRGRSNWCPCWARARRTCLRTGRLE